MSSIHCKVAGFALFAYTIFVIVVTTAEAGELNGEQFLIIGTVGVGILGGSFCLSKSIAFAARYLHDHQALSKAFFMVLGALVLLVIAHRAGLFGPPTYEDCVLEYFSRARLALGVIEDLCRDRSFFGGLFF